MTRIQTVHRIVPIRQRTPSDCWAAALAMVRGTIHHRSATVADIREIAQQGHIRMEADGTLPLYDGVNASRLATALGLTYRRVRETALTLRIIERLLVRGRLAILGALNNPFRLTVTNHAITVFSLVGDGTDGGTNIAFVDPYDGQRVTHPWGWFEQNILVDPHFVISH